MRVLFVFLLLTSLDAREPLDVDRGAAGLRQSLRRLQTAARAMHITAHPDDEDGGTITLLSRGQGVDMTLLILNRGESGANLVSGDFFEALGALRTGEILRAAEYYGARVRFTRFIDYGYSKNVAETFRNWDQEAVLRDVVRIIRREKPHVLISRWQGVPRDGHGNHEAAGILARLAFDAAGDPQRFPELAAEGLAAWQPLKLYSNNRRENDEWTLRVDSGVYDPALGRTYAQMARDGLRHQRSQGAGSAISRPGPQVSYYKLLASKVGMADKEAGFFERIGTPLPPELARPVAEAVEAFSMDHPEACAPALARALEAASRILPEKLPRIRRALEQSLGLTLDARVEPKNPRAGPFASFQPSETFSLATPGQTFPVAVTLYGAPAVKTELLVPPGFAVRETGPGRFSVTVPEHPPYTQAYWRRDSVRESSYRIEDPRRFTRPLPEAPARARVTYRVGAVEATIERAVETGFLDTLGVEHRKTLAVGPPIAVRFSTEAGVLPLGKREYDLACTVRSHVDGKAAGAVRIGLPSGWRSEPAQAPFAFEKEKEETILNFRVIAPAGAPAAEYKLEAVAAYNGREYRDSFREVTQPGLSSVYLAAPAVHLLRVADVKVAPGLRAGYVMGTGDQVPEGLRQLGVPVDLLDRTALESGDLSRYSTILLGIRAYAARDDVKAFNGRLLDYVRNGGVLIVQYNTPEYDRNYGPYPYTMGRNPEEVSEEDSPVRILEPSHPVFTTPNRITLKDFEGWVEQRGSKFWTTWDPRYTALLETHDTGQPPQRGGWLVAPYGKGLYVYCAYAWYRQLPYAVPGAVRLFANLVSLGAR